MIARVLAVRDAGPGAADKRLAACRRHGEGAAAFGSSEKLAQLGSLISTRNGAGLQVDALLAELGRAIETQKRQPAPVLDGAELADLDAARHDLRSGLRQRRLSHDGHHPLARYAAVLHARDDLLADEAALLEGHSVQLIEQRLVREGVAEHVVLAALGHAERDAMRVILVRRGAVGLIAGERPIRADGDELAIAHLGQSRIGEPYRLLAAPVRLVGPAPDGGDRVVGGDVAECRPWP